MKNLFLIAVAVLILLFVSVRPVDNIGALMLLIAFVAAIYGVAGLLIKSFKI